MTSRDEVNVRAPVELIGSEVSLYTGKVRAYLRYKRIPFKETLATAQVYKNTIIPRTGVRFIPVLITDDDLAIQDSTDILDELERRHPEPSIYPSTPRQRLAALLLELYGDEWLVLPAMHYRWQYPENRRFAVQEFGRTSAPARSFSEQIEIGEKLSAPFAGALPHLGITDRTSAAIEKSYLAFLDDFEKHLHRHAFLLGSRPSIGDFGLIGPLYAHLYRDPASGKLMKQRSPHVAAWVERMIQPLGSVGSFLPDDVLPDTLQPILQRMFAEQVPVILATMQAVATWIERHPNDAIPRSVGKVIFHVEGVSETCAAYPYRQWMWQRCVTLYRQLQGREQTLVQKWLSTVPGAIEALETPIRWPLERRNNRLVLGAS